jgi:hypothetical protein
VDESLISLLESPYELEIPPHRFKYSEIQTVINNLSPKTSPGYDPITDKILEQLPPNGIKYITHLFNTSLLLGYFPNQWKVAQIILLLKPGKPPNDPSSYRPISLLPIIEKQQILPNHQFGFRQHHSAIQQTQRIVNKINESLDTKQYCSAAFLDISQVWHTGLVYKLRHFSLSNISFFLNPT